MPVHITEEGDCLSHINKLQEIRGSTRDHVILFGFQELPEHYVPAPVDPPVRPPAGTGNVPSEDDHGSDNPPISKHLDNFYDSKYHAFYTDDYDDCITRDLESIDKDEYIRVVCFGKCSKELAKGFVLAVQSEPHQTTLPRIPNFLDSPNLRRVIEQGNFITGISLRGVGGNDPRLTLFVAMPYLGPKKRPAQEILLSRPSPRRSEERKLLSPHTGPTQEQEEAESATLGQFLLGRDSIWVRKSDENCGVYQAWFVLTDDRTMAVFRSEDEITQRSPLFPYQKRICAFSAMLQMLSNLFQPFERELLQNFRRTVAQQMDDARPSVPGLDPKERQEAAMAGLKESINDLSGMISVIDTQVSLLRDLHDIFDNHSRMDAKRPHRNAVRLPYVPGPEGQKTIGALLDVLLEERRNFSTELKLWLHQLTQESLGGEEARRSEKMQKQLEQQGQTISIFTLFTSTFLPLMFLTGYFGMNPPSDWEGAIKSQGQFWIYSGPISAIIIGIMIIFLYMPDRKIKDYIKMIWRKNPFSLKGTPGPLNP